VGSPPGRLVDPSHLSAPLNAQSPPNHYFSWTSLPPLNLHSIDRYWRGRLRCTLSLVVGCPGGVPEEPRPSPQAGRVTCWSCVTCRRIPGSSLFSMGYFPGHNASGEACGTLGWPGAPYRAWVVARLPPFAEPSRPSLAPQKPRLWPPFPPILYPTVPRPAPGLHRSLPVVPLIGDKRYYGETPMRLRWGYGGWPGAYPAEFTLERGPSPHAHPGLLPASQNGCRALRVA
jgi:hypothetical protein